MLANLSREEKQRQRYIRDVRRLLIGTFNLSDAVVIQHNEIWAEWLQAEQRERNCRELQRLVSDNLADVFKARAIAILLSPSIELAPFKWYNKSLTNDHLPVHSYVNLAELSPQLRKFTLALLEFNIDVALEPGASEDVRRTLFGYNDCIREALAILPEDDAAAARLFDRYQLNDPLPYGTPEEESGYNEFYDILQANIPEIWKKLADERMREVIRDEQAGRAKPRNDWERALPCYLHHIESCLCEKAFPYSADLFASQIEFILGLPDTGGRLFRDHRVSAILALLSGDARKGLRHRFASRVAFAVHDGHFAFTVYEHEARDAATAMLKEFGKDDSALCNRLSNAIAEANESEIRSRTAFLERHAREEAVLARMR